MKHNYSGHQTIMLCVLYIRKCTKALASRRPPYWRVNSKMMGYDGQLNLMCDANDTRLTHPTGVASLK